MSYSDFESCLKKVSKEVDIHFTGMCEPWINPECSEMVLFTLKKGHKVGISTTLMGMHLKDIERLEPYTYKFFAIHLPSDSKKESIKVNENYRTLLSAIINSKISATFHVQGEGFSTKIKALLKGQHVNRYKPHSRAGNVMVSGKKKKFFLKSKIGCHRGLKQNVLMPNGDLLLCCMDYGMRHIIGNLLETDLQTIYRGKEFKKIVNGMLNDREDILCRRCERYAYPLGIRSKIINKYLS
jgi:radical SAM protein with 4Fe4S-binding SPASM domain